MKNFVVWLLIMFSVNTFAHDEAHGPQLSDAPKQGGLVASVILFKEESLGAKAQLKRKAEIVRSQDGTVRVYFYDITMGPLKSGLLAVKASGNLISGKKGKIKQQKFELTWKEDHFEGKSPKPTRKPYNIDVKVLEGTSELFVAFDNLD